MTGVFKRLTEPLEHLETQKIRKISSTVKGAKPIAELEPRKRTKVAGLVQNMRIDPKNHTGTLDVTRNDGTGLVKARWSGRLRIPGIDVGRYISVEGTPIIGEQEELVFLNPFYELVPSE
ncbi:MAG: hypothetical protein C4318_03705 [Acidimicrobiia bacterium]